MSVRRQLHFFFFRLTVGINKQRQTGCGVGDVGQKKVKVKNVHKQK